jgi:two-component system sensor histidine kinase EvgS
VESPVKAAEAHLEALSRELRDDPRLRVRDRLGDARAALGQIAALARQLLVAGRAAGPEGPAVDVRVMPAAEDAIAAARARGVPEGVVFEVAASPGLTVEAQEQEVRQVLATLVLRAVSRVPARRPGKVTIRAQSAGERIRIAVEDDGPELSEEELRHAFEPFHETEGVAGAGLALAFARGLVEGMGGTLSLERETVRGTRVIVELARGAPATSPADLPAAPVVAPRRARILLADRDARTLRELVQALSAEHEVEAVSSVREALAALADRTFDLILCDAALPGGGGERFWQELLLEAPALQARVAFVASAPEETPSVHDFLARQPQPVLRRPFGLAEVQVAFDWLGIPGSQAPRPGPADGPDRVIGRMRGR